MVKGLKKGSPPCFYTPSLLYSHFPFSEYGPTLVPALSLFLTKVSENPFSVAPLNLEISRVSSFFLSFAFCSKLKTFSLLILSLRKGVL